MELHELLTLAGWAFVTQEYDLAADYAIKANCLSAENEQLSVDIRWIVALYCAQMVVQRNRHTEA